MGQELKVIADFYDFMLWMTHHTEKFPRHHRYSLGVSMELHGGYVNGAKYRPNLPFTAESAEIAERKDGIPVTYSFIRI